jgi:hypothetical protein
MNASGLFSNGLGMHADAVPPATPRTLSATASSGALSAATADGLFLPPATPLLPAGAL